MQEILQNIDIDGLVSALWTIVVLPVLTCIGTRINKWLEARNLDKYKDILYAELKNAVKSVYETEVKDIKHTAGWTSEKQEEVKKMAGVKALHALPPAVYKSLKDSNDGLEEYLDSLIGSALYDLKHRNG